MKFKLATSRPAQAVVTPNNSTGHDSDGGRTAGTPPVGVGATGASGNHPCETPLCQASPGVPGAPTARCHHKLFVPNSSSTRAAGPDRVRDQPPEGPAGAATDSPPLQLKQRTFRFSTWNMLGQKQLTPSGLVPQFPHIDSLLSLE